MLPVGALFGNRTRFLFHELTELTGKNGVFAPFSCQPLSPNLNGNKRNQRKITGNNRKQRELRETGVNAR